MIMNLQVMPQRLAIALGVGAFLIVWAAGLLGEVPAYRISLRAVAAAAVFGVAGLVGGRILLNSICEAFGEHLYGTQDDSDLLPQTPSLRDESPTRQGRYSDGARTGGGKK